MTTVSQLLDNARQALSRGLGDDGLRLCDTACALDPSNDKTWFEAGAQCWEYNRSLDAVRYLTRALQLNPQHLEALRIRAMALHDIGRYHEALVDQTRYSLVDPFDATVKYSCGVTLRMMERERDSLREFTLALELNPSDSWTYCERGLAHIALRELAQAESDAKRAIEVSPRVYRGHYCLALVYSEKRRTEDAINSISTAIECDPRVGYLYELLHP